MTNRMGLAVWGPDAPRRVAADSTWKKPVGWERNWRRFADETGRFRRVFCASLADVFEDHPALPEPRARLWRLIEETPHLIWLLLTKRPENFERFLPDGWGDGWPNVWLGVSVENTAFTWRAELLRETPAVLRFVSAEPLLRSLVQVPRVSEGSENGSPLGEEGSSGVTSRHVGEPRKIEGGQSAAAVRDERAADSTLVGGRPGPRARAPLDLRGIGWLIVGGESGGRKSRPMHPAWARELRDACMDRQALEGYRTSFHLKQWGSWMPDQFGRDPNGQWLTYDGRLVSSFAIDAYDLNVDGAMRVRYAGRGPGSGGKYLDGVDWCEVPNAGGERELVLC